MNFMRETPEQHSKSMQVHIAKLAIKLAINAFAAIEKHKAEKQIKENQELKDAILKAKKTYTPILANREGGFYAKKCTPFDRKRHNKQMFCSKAKRHLELNRARWGNG